MRVLGIDPGLASLGYALVELTSEDVIVLSMGCVRTKKTDAKRKVRASDDNIERIREVFRNLYPLTDGIMAICSESQSWPRNASACAKVGMAWGVIGALSELMDVPILQVSPQQLKKVVCGDGTASKAEVAAALNTRFGRDFSIELVENGVPSSAHEHPYDALGAIVSCLDDEVLRLARRLS